MSNQDFALIDPSRPLLALVRDFRARLWLRDEAPDTELELEGVLAEMFFLFLRETHSSVLTTTARLNEYCEHLERLCNAEVSTEDLRSAPQFEKWCVCLDHGAPVLIGSARDHPLLGHVARMRSSPLFRLEVSEHWARSWSRVYVLGDYDETVARTLALTPLEIMSGNSGGG
ncbi:DUF6634 family protein [Roseovarius mucosus]|uniref:DUF6634 family protein n=1 Tax=Roseovarius mucosus TaxID=215743 RepID=UPI0035D0F610